MNTRVIFGQPSVSVLGLKKICFSVISGSVKCTGYINGNSYSTISQIKDWINYGGWNKFYNTLIYYTSIPLTSHSN